MSCNCNSLAEDVAPFVPAQQAPKQTFLQRHEIDFKAPWSKNEKVAGAGAGAAILGGLWLAFRKKRK